MNIDLDKATRADVMQLLRDARPIQDNVGRDWSVEQSQAYRNNQRRDIRVRPDGYSFDQKSSNSALAPVYRVVATATFNNVHVNFGTIVAGGSVSINFSVTDAALGDFVSPAFSTSLPADVSVTQAEVINSSGSTRITLSNSGGSNRTLTNPTNLTINASR